MAFSKALGLLLKGLGTLLDTRDIYYFPIYDQMVEDNWGMECILGIVERIPYSQKPEGSRWVRGHFLRVGKGHRQCWRAQLELEVSRCSSGADLDDG